MEYPPLPPPPGGEVDVADELPGRPEGSGRKGVFVVTGILIGLVGVAAVAVWWLGTPDRCQASTVESARFGYCIAAPGWELTQPPPDTDVPYDELIKGTDASTVRIMAIRLQVGQGLEDVVEATRDDATAAGFELGEVIDRRVAGVPAAQWDVALDGGRVAQQARDIVFVRGDAAWVVRLQTDAERFAVRIEELEDILRTWTFR